MATWLTDINLLELSPVRRPANRKRAILRKSEQEITMPNRESFAEKLAKAELSDEQKQAVMAALDALEETRDTMDGDAFEMATAALATLLMPEVPSEEDMAEAEQEGTQEELEEEMEDKAEGEGKGDMEEKVCEDEDKMEHEEKEEVSKSEDFEAILKAREDELVELRKSLADRDEEIKSKSYLEKAESFGTVPMAKDELAGLLRIVDESDAEGAYESLTRLLAGVGQLVEKSEAFQELGGSGEAEDSQPGVMGKIDALADSYVQKSEGKITKEKAIAEVLKSNPALYTEWLNQG
jgi:hypothetical protein